MKNAIIIALSLVALAACCISAEEFRCRGEAAKNVIPVFSSEPVFVRNVTNGKLFVGGSGNDTFHVVHLWGTPYEQGVAQGKLFGKERLMNMYNSFVAYLEGEAKTKVPWLPTWLIDLVGEFGLPFVLQLSVDWTKPYTPQRYLDEMRGIAHGGDVAESMVEHMNAFPELIKAACTIVGANHNSSIDGKLYQLRGLDFSDTMPIKDNAQLTIYHSSNDEEASIANFGWTGMIGSLTGLSNRAIGVGEKVWLDHDKGVEGVHGQPWMFILRDVLYTKNLSQALDVIKNANKTCAIHAGVGDSTSNSFRGVQMAKHWFKVYNDTTHNYPQHPLLPGIVYWDKHKQPTSSYCLSDLLKHYYGRIDAERLVLDIASIGETGDMHCVSFDYMNQIAYFANARKTGVSTGLPQAWGRQFNRIDLKKLFAEPKP